jgi:U3 small nucleolar RNA-associated protein 10
MASLAAQLKERQFALNATQVTPQGQVRARSLRVSLLFDTKKAETLEDEVVCALGENGWEELQQEDAALERFRGLFGPAALDVRRQLNTKKDNSLLDREINAYLHAMSGYLMRPAAHKTLEWLIRQYHIQEHNVLALLACALPYHATMLFARIVSLLNLTDLPDWQFLTVVQRTAQPLDRVTLITRARRSNAVFAFICQLPTSLLALVPAPATVHHAIALTTSVVAGVFAAGVDDIVLTTV